MQKNSYIVEIDRLIKKFNTSDLYRWNSNKAFFLFLIFFLITAYSCSTKKNTFTRRVFHNLTGHYNMFWNGRESYREGVQELNKSALDNYNKVLPVFNYGTESNAQSMNPYMDRAIEKASINIQRHSMYFNRKEYVRWIDDSYMLIGLGYFYKQEYNKARRTFEFIINEYKNNKIKYDAMLWLGNSYNQLEKYNRSQSVLDNLKNELDKGSEASNKVRKMLPLVRANTYILQEKYGQSKELLIDALLLRQKRPIDTRVRYILGQIYQQEEEYYRASEYYRQVIKKNPPYEMAFNAAINLARCYDTRYGENSNDIVKQLNKMLKEDKNLDFRDQIYYALAEIALKEENDTLAIQHLAKSVATSKKNNFQKATSALKLAQIYFYIPEYELSQAYYDTAIQVLPTDFPDYKNIKGLSLYLTELVENLITIKTQDSLQMLANLNEDERNAIIDKIIKDAKIQEEKQKELDELKLLAGNNVAENTSNIGGVSGGDWYFYNNNAKSFGLTEFRKKWGTRKLEDNWRLSNKQVIFEPTQVELVAELDSIAGDSALYVSNDPYTREYYLKDIPFTETQLAISDSLIEQAYYNLGFIYKDKLVDQPKAIESFETLLERFPLHKNRLQVYYQLYRLYTKDENVEKAEFYKNMIIDQYPESDYAKLLLDPNYYKELEAQRNLAQTLYNETYEHYEAQRYYTVYSNSLRALSEFEDPPELLAKFEYLKAISLGKIEVVDSLKAALENLVIKYPDSEVTPMAQNILDYLKDPNDTTSTKEPEEVIDVSIYDFDPDSKQIFAMVVADNKININALKVRISDFNMKYYSLENLSITNILLDATTHFVMVGNFNTIDNAMNYFNAIKTNEYVYGGMDQEDYDGFIISQENYPIFYKDKDLKKYLAFFRQNYFKEQ